MALRLEDKKKIVEQLTEIAKHSSAVVAANYRGLTVGQMNDLRVSARQSDVHVQVVRNNLARRALESTEFSCMKDALIGPIVLVFSRQDPGASARLVRDFAKANAKLEVKVLSMAGELLEASAIDRIANLPTREQALVQLVNTLQAPIVCSVKAMSAIYIQFVRVCSKVAEQSRSE